MKLKTITLTNFRCFRNFSLDLDEQLTVLVAQNGAGKTAILDAIAIGLGPFVTHLPNVSGRNFQKGDFLVEAKNKKKPPYMRVVLESQTGMKWDRTQKRDGSRETLEQIPKAKGIKPLQLHVDQYIDAYNNDLDFKLPIIAYYGTGRGFFDGKHSRINRSMQKDFPRFQAFSLDEIARYLKLLEYLYFLENLALRKARKEGKMYDESHQLKAIYGAIEKGMPTDGKFRIENPRITLRPSRFVIDWKNLDTGEVKELGLDQLSAGYQSMLTLIMDLASRMVQANPDMPDPLLTEGIVLIDEVDLYLHPGWQQTVIGSLQETFPNIQFIVTTHSPQVLTTVPHESIRVIDWENDERVVKRVEFSEGLQAQQMLHTVLGTNPRPNVPIAQDLKDYFALVNNDEWESDDAIGLRAKLDKHPGYESELLKADMDIRFRKRRQARQ